MSPIPCTKSKLSFGLFRSKKNQDQAASSSSAATPNQAPPAAQFDASAPLAKNFRKLSIQVDQNNVRPKAPAAAARVGLPSIDEVAIARRHTAPATSAPHYTQRILTESEVQSLSRPEREAHYARELANDKEPESPLVALHLEPLPADFNVKIPKTFGAPGKSILKKNRSSPSAWDALPRIDEKVPLPTPRRQSTVNSSISDDSFGGGTLSRTVSFDRHTEAHQKKRKMLQEEKEFVTAFKRAIAHDEALKNARRSF